MTEASGEPGEHEPGLRWVDLENLYASAYLKGEQSDEFVEIDGSTESLRLYLRYKPFNLRISRPLFPEKAPGIAFWIRLTAPKDRPELSRELYTALIDKDQLMLLQDNTAEAVGADKTEEILKMVREGHLIPASEFTDETE